MYPYYRREHEAQIGVSPEISSNACRASKSGAVRAHEALLRDFQIFAARFLDFFIFCWS
jgi:hypothetical protein